MGVELQTLLPSLWSSTFSVLKDNIHTERTATNNEENGSTGDGWYYIYLYLLCESIIVVYGLYDT